MVEEEYAGFWIRFGAQLIDLVIVLVVLCVPLTFIYGTEYWIGDKFIYGFWDFTLNYVMPAVATVWFWLRYLGTPGKMVMKLKIVDSKSRKKLSMGQAIGRYFAYLLAILPFGFGMIWIGIDEKKQGWHDKLAGTIVLKKKNSASGSLESET